ncbi:possible N-formylglutamate amidohydrolase [Oceanicola granulosus HTCC2516]|uniref:Possible N-formylglutamate amidohydrolase n=1 Tax=Oceanicola granulosus (strain ATCC BAA-861 / DSM 15982 / KCTC 12143 / HTCC2516) TaxID=314256 RepID=Q2CDS7_OCEGH|nr:N-formylglutamate amidohydrolase [Oceanicola granulosus]EAR50773.1 possible N-formylglutamate amidohydrolase [Oceanicola granulosus HTCC2516]
MTDTAYEIVNGAADSPWLLTCDHASNRVPEDVAGGDLGLPASEMERHIAYDVGAAGVTRHLAELLGAPAVLGRFSRLVIDPNRGADDPTLVMKLYDGTIIPANRHADAAEVARRKATLYDPYHAAVADLAARRSDTLYVAIHSFTPRLVGRRPRPWHIGILHAWDKRLSVPVLERLAEEPDLIVGDNEPYGGHLPGDAVDRHALQHGRPNALIEVRHDLIADAAGQRAWAERLAPVLEDARARMGD